MPIATSTALIIGGVAAAAGGVASSVIGARAAGKAAGAQVKSADYAAELTRKSQQEALEFQKEQWETQQENIAPFLEAGQGAVTTLSSLMPSLTTPWTEEFKAPDAETLKLDPGYQFRLEEGKKALERSAAARGGLTSGGTIKATERYAQGMASQEYQNAYNRSLTEYQQAYNIFQQNQANKYNRYAALAGTGQTAAGQLGAEGTAASGNVENILMGGAMNLSQLVQNAAAARASGYVGGANAITGGIGAATGGLSNYLLLSSLMGNPNGSGYMVPSDYPISG